MSEQEWLAQRFEADRGRLQAVAYRMLGSQAEADDAVQEAWLRVSRADAGSVENMTGWLTTIVARVCLNMLQSRKSRREEPIADDVPIAAHSPGTDPEDEAVTADSVGLALLVVLETLTPAERVAFVLHDMFDLPFDEIAPIVNRTPAAARQLASRARRRVRPDGRPSGRGAEVPESDRNRQREIVDAFLAAARGGNFARLLALLDPDVVLRADPVAVQFSAAARGGGALRLEPEIRGATAVAGTFSGRAAAAQPALINGAVGLAWAPGGRTRALINFTIVNGRIVEIDLTADQDAIGRLDVTFLES